MQKLTSLLILGSVFASLQPAHAGFIIGKYSDELNSILVCKLTSTYPDKQISRTQVEHEEAECTGTLINGRFFTTVKHCVQDSFFGKIEKPIVTCYNSSGQAAFNAPVTDIRLFEHTPINTEGEDLGEAATEPAIVSVDASIIPSDFTKEKVRLPKSVAESNALLNTGDCFMSGYGINADGGSGVLHSTKVPGRFMRGSAKTLFQLERDIVLLYSGQNYLSLVHVTQSQALKEAAELIIYGGPSYGLGTTLAPFPGGGYGNHFMTPDANALNGIDEGDSGGPLFCHDSDKKLVQMAVATASGKEILNQNNKTIESIFISLTRPAVAKWLQESMQTMK